ncbi:MAG: amidohydrolase family protein [Chloroflexi bacterium]|nr:amidohydrolase family protein [Chloroflexota bacterium]
MEPILPIPIIDFHLHFPVKHDVFLDGWEQRYVDRFGAAKLQIIQQRKVELQKRWRNAYLIPPPEEQIPSNEIQAERWVAEAKKYRMEKAVFLTGGGNDQLASIIKMAPEIFVGFAHHDPYSPGAPEELTRAVETLGLRGYKILAPTVPYPLDDPKLDPLWSVAEKYRLPVLIHFGIEGGGGGIGNAVNINPLVMHDVAKGFPDIPFIIPHFGCGYTRELLQLAWACPNVYVDTTGTNDWMRWMPYPVTIQNLFRIFVETVGPERIIFGTDSDHFPRGFAYANFMTQWQACMDIGLKSDELQLIFHDNGARLLDQVCLY